MKNLTRLITLFFFLLLFNQAAFSNNDVFACSPDQELTKPLAICAIAHGGCAIVSNFAALMDSAAQRFFLSGGCNALAAEMTGEGNGVAGFLGDATTSQLDSYYEESINDNDPDNDGVAKLGKLLSSSYKIAKFYSCVNSAKTKCQTAYAEKLANERYVAKRETYQETNNSNIIAQNNNQVKKELTKEEFFAALKKFTTYHFSVDSVCNVEESIKLYGDFVSYEGELLSKEDVRLKKQLACEKNNNNFKYAMVDRANGVSYSMSPDKNSITIDYDVSFEGFSQKQNKNINGVTSVSLKFNQNGIISEKHQKVEVAKEDDDSDY